MKRATVLFTRPGIGQTIIQEDAGKVSERLRRSIEAAHKAFWREYRKLKELPE